jgi:hypothetical protein
MREFTKSERRELRALVELARDREMTSHLESLAKQFDRWRNGAIGPWELADEIHEFHQGPNRDLHNRDPGNSMLLIYVVRAVNEGFLSREEIPDRLRADVNQVMGVMSP